MRPKDPNAALSKALVRIIADVADDPRYLKPGQLCRLLNSTSLGEVLTDQRLRAHRARAGARIGDGKTVDLIRYAAWLAGERRRGVPAPSVSQETFSFRDAYERKKERDREFHAKESRSGRDLGQLPGPEDPKRRAAAEASFRVFLETYFPDRFSLEWSTDHLAMIAQIERIVDVGGLKAFAMPRGSGKTTLCECAVLWALLTGRRKFVALVGASREHANEMLESIKGELDTNDLLAADFPEVCLPIRALEGIAQRCKGQICQGERTHMRWSGPTIVLPTVKGSKASGGVICARGITGRVRGMKFLRPDGQTVRPDLAIVDDPQTDQSARSPNQCTKRLRICTGAILGLAGPGKTMAAFMPCTIIVKDDMADQVLNRDKHPAWGGVCTRLVHKWPHEEKLWDQYAEIRRGSQRNGGEGEEATAFYKKNRKVMDAGAELAWPARKLPHELSAIQHAMNLRIDHPHTFDAEYQNAPKIDKEEGTIELVAGELARKLSGLEKGVLPLACQIVTAFIDVQQRALFWVICGWAHDFTGIVLDYGTWPDQERSYFTYADAKRTIQQRFPKANLNGQLRGALESLTDQLLQRTFVREDHAEFRIRQLGIDSGFKATDVVYPFCRESKHAALLIPTKGLGITASRKALHEYQIAKGSQLGTHWLLGRPENQRAVRLLTYDTNHWKTEVSGGLAAPIGDRGSITLSGRGQVDHELLSHHCTSEYATKTFGRGRVVFEWKQKPERTDNHWWDGIVGCAVLASMHGCSHSPTSRPAKRKRHPPRPRVAPLFN